MRKHIYFEFLPQLPKVLQGVKKSEMEFINSLKCAIIEGQDFYA